APVSATRRRRALTGRGRWSGRPERRRSSRLLLCPRPSCQVQRMFPTCTVKQSFTIVGGPRAEPASPVPAARTAQAGDDDGGRERSFDVAVGGVPAALAARAGDEGLPLPAGGQAGGAHRLRGAAGAARRGDAGTAGGGRGRARPRAGAG